MITSLLQADRTLISSQTVPSAAIWSRMGTKSDPVSKPGTTNVPGGSRARPEADHAPGTSRGGNSHWASRRLGFSAAETADILDTTPASVDSALRRARTTLDDRLPGGGAALALPADLVARYVRAWHAQDVPSLVAVLQEDAYTAMPPTPPWYQGRDHIGT